MKIYKIFLYALLSLILLVLVVAALVPDNITITTNITIYAKPEKIYNNVASLKKWKHWSPFEHDSTMVDSFSGPTSGVGATRTWKGKVIGTGKMTVEEATPYSRLTNQLDFNGKGNATGTWTFTPIDTTNTRVTWSTHIGGFKYPFERLIGTILDRMMMPMFEQGLKDLKTYVETGKSVSIRQDTVNRNIKVHE